MANGSEIHNLRHSLSDWLVNKAKVEPKTVQGTLRHAKDSDDARSVHAGGAMKHWRRRGEYLTALGVGTEMVH